MKNNFCVCGSGKEQKDCPNRCHKIEISIVDDQKKVVEIRSYWVNTKQILPIGMESTDTEIMHNALKIRKKDPQRAVRIYKNLLKKYPGQHTILNNLACHYTDLGKDQEAQEIFEKNVKDHPSYTFSRVALGLLYLKHNKTDKIPEVLGNRYEISFVWPDRKIFHLTEVLGFNFLVGSYYWDIDNIDQAKQYLRMIKNLDPNSIEAKELEKRIEMKEGTDDLRKILEVMKSYKFRKRKTSACVKTSADKKNTKKVKNVG
jgi:tetratricopeptide (TPR) repeat protein